MAQVTDTHSALIVAHGSPSAPGGPERAIQKLADRVQNLLPDWTVAGATLAGPNTLETAFAGLPSAPLVYPLFMSDGWFVNTALPRRLRAIGGMAGAASTVAPLGLDPALHALCIVAAEEAAARGGLVPSETALVMAAHGSPSDPRPRLAAERAARHVEASSVFHGVRLGFVDEPPHLSRAARIDSPALCLPYFAMQAGHVEIDIPEALREAEFRGPCADPIGTHRGVPEIIANALIRATMSIAA